MAMRGIWQLKRMQVYFCDYSGASKGMREFLMGNKLEQFMQKNPQIEFEFIRQKNRRPKVEATYINGYTRLYPAENREAEDILDNMEMQVGRKRRPFKGTGIQSSRKSVQGRWTANLWNSYPQHELEVIRKLPEIDWIDVEPRKKPAELVARPFVKDHHKVKGDFGKLERNLIDFKMNGQDGKEFEKL